MDWNAGPIYSAIIISVIILIYSKKYSGIRTVQNQLFRSVLITTILSMITLVTSVYLSSHITEYPLLIVELFNVISRILMTIIAPLFFYYIVSIIWQDKEVLLKWIRYTAWIYVLFALLIISSPFTGIIYYIATDRLAEGPLYNLMYFVPSIFLGFIVMITIYMNDKLSRGLKFVILAIPVFSLVLVIVEFFFPTLLISSTAATASLVISYLYIQNRKILEDDLTRTMNRRAFAQTVDILLKEGKPYRVTLVSIDDFKNINNQFGEQVGDVILKDFADFLLTLQPDAQVFRFSGDEFAILTPDGFQLDLIEKIQTRLAEPWEVEHILLNFGATIAELKIPDVTVTLEDMINVLEYCIRSAKSRQKGGSVVIGKESLNLVKRRYVIHERLKEMIQQRDLDVYYQPIYYSAKGNYPIFEALARLSCEELGSIPPLEFIAIAEEKGLINDLGQILLEKVCKTIKLLQRKNIDFESININFSPIQMNNDYLVSEVTQLIEREQVEPSRIHLEITESVVIDNFEKVNEMMVQFNELGIQFSLDDYGTGYSNLANIIYLPFKIIKLDKSLLYKSGENKEMFVFIQSLVRSFQQIGKQIIIEGVETEQHVELAEMLGCDYIQGYYFSKPLPETDLVAFLSKETDV